MVDTHTGSPMVRPVAFEWMLNCAPSATNATTAEPEPMETDVEKPDVSSADEQHQEGEEAATEDVVCSDGGSDRLFACPRCALSGVDGNTLARHLVEDCGSEGATLIPDPEIVAARKHAEEQMCLHQEQQVCIWV